MHSMAAGRSTSARLAEATGDRPASSTAADEPEGGAGASVRIVGLVKDFDAVRAVDDVSLDVRAGEFLSLLGPSGSGKTTILMSTAGFERPTAGGIFVGDREVTHAPPNKRNIGMVFQKYALFPHLSIFDNVAFPLRRRRVKKDEVERRVAEALEMVRLTGYEKRKPAQLSGGQQQRVALARATVFRPPLLLMDEPLGALDKKLRGQVQLEIKHLQRRLGTTVIYVTHDQDEALTMSDRVAVINEGRLEQIGTPEDLYERPVNPFVADFVGEMNFIAGTMVSREADRCSVALRHGPTVDALLGPEVTAQPGVCVRVAIRPERIGVTGTDADRDANVGTVRETIYAGDRFTVMVELSPGELVTARLPAGGEQASWRAGDRVALDWRARDARVFGAAG
jgi:spermidine/putrescine ABC transporter ATP-binding subunit